MLSPSPEVDEVEEDPPPVTTVESPADDAEDPVQDDDEAREDSEKEEESAREDSSCAETNKASDTNKELTMNNKNEKK